jgi:formylglycine-generating enzyme required for sulfatase activity
MVEIPAGSFMRESPESNKENDDIKPSQHRVRVSVFYAGKYEVTQAQW